MATLFFISPLCFYQDIIWQILCGVDFLHSHRIVHRDLKPQNLLVTRDGNVKLTDFGLARIYEFYTLLTSVVVTLWYRSPEVLMGLPYATPVDIWSCGCIFAELFLRKPLFPGNYEMDQLQKVFDVVGTPSEEDWPEKAAVTRTNFKASPARRWRDIVPEMDEHAQDLIRVSTPGSWNHWTCESQGRFATLQLSLSLSPSPPLPDIRAEDAVLQP